VLRKNKVNHRFPNSSILDEYSVTKFNSKIYFQLFETLKVLQQEVTTMHSKPNMPTSVRLSDEGRKIADQKRREKGFNRQDVRWYTKAHTTVPTLKRFWAYNIRLDNFEALCEVIGVDWQTVVDWSSIIDLPLDILNPIDPLELESNFYINRPQEDECYKLIKSEKSEKSESIKSQPESNFHINSSQENECDKSIKDQSILIRIKAPPKMGKTSFLTRVLSCADKSSYLNCRLDFSSIQIDVRSNLRSLLFWFCTEVTNEIGIAIEPLEEYWSKKISSQLGAELDWCTDYFERYLLHSLQSRLVLGLDEVDSIFPQNENDEKANEVAANFMTMLRSWYQWGQEKENWRKLIVVISHSKKDYPNLNVNNSPFNVGHAIELKPFSQSQIAELVERYQLNFSSEEIQRLFNYFGGQPYLSHRAIYEIKTKKVSLVQMLQEAPTEGGLFGDLLRSLLSTLDEHDTLKSEFIKVLQTSLAIQIESKEAFQLYSMGLVKYLGNDIVLSGEIYRQYFCNRFRIES
jgi:AAA-like domain